MMKKIILLLSALLMSACSITHSSFKPVANPNPVDPTSLKKFLETVNADNDRAFGTRRGMTKQDISDYGVYIYLIDENQDAYTYTAKTAPKTNKNFNLYAYEFNKYNRLCTIAGLKIISPTQTDKIKKEINILKNILIDLYGEPQTKDYSANKKEPEKNKGKEEYEFYWRNESTNKSKIAYILLYSKVETDKKAYISLTYYLLPECDKTDKTGL